MRISQEQTTLIKNIIRSKDSQAKIFLYGSRTKDHLKGGDIDLLVVSEKLAFSDKIDLLIEIKKKIGEQKIDLSIQTEKSLQDNAFFQSILNEAVELN